MFFVIALLAVAATEVVAAPLFIPAFKSRSFGQIGLHIDDFVPTPSLAVPVPTETSVTIITAITTTPPEGANPTASIGFDYAAHAVGAAGVVPADADALQGSKVDPTTAETGAPYALLLSTVPSASTSATGAGSTAHLSTVGVADVPVASFVPPRIGTVKLPSAVPS